jgi:hypothetical protein
VTETDLKLGDRTLHVYDSGADDADGRRIGQAPTSWVARDYLTWRSCRPKREYLLVTSCLRHTLASVRRLPCVVSRSGRVDRRSRPPILHLYQVLNARSTPSLGETDHVEHASAVLVRQEPVRARHDALTCPLSLCAGCSGADSTTSCSTPPSRWWTPVRPTCLSALAPSSSRCSPASCCERASPFHPSPGAPWLSRVSWL